MYQQNTSDVSRKGMDNLLSDINTKVNNCRGFVANTPMPRDGGNCTLTREAMGGLQMHAGTGGI